jgi:hypothetical protein
MEGHSWPLSSPDVQATADHSQRHQGEQERKKRKHGGDALDEFGDLRNKRICVGVRVPEHHVTPRGQHHSLVLNTCRRVGACRCVGFKAVCSEQ